MLMKIASPIDRRLNPIFWIFQKTLIQTAKFNNWTNLITELDDLAMIGDFFK